MLAGPVSAETVLVPPDPWEVIHVAREFGAADVSRDAMGEPMIVGKLGTLDYKAVFHGCAPEQGCTAMLLRTRFFRDRWEDDPVEHALLRRWNARKLFGRAYRADDGALWLDHPVAMAGGLPPETLRATLRQWHDTLAEFADFVDF